MKTALQRTCLWWLVLITFFPMPSAYCQQKEDTGQAKKELTLSLEFRPRTEYRNGYRQMRTDTSSAAFFTEGRSRLNLSFNMKRFIFYTSVQDVRIWGEKDPRSTVGSIQVFEAYAEPVLAKGLSARIGRQRVMYDNQRLFAQNDWRQSAGSHDGLRLMYKSGKLESELFGAFNQEGGEHFFETDFSPDFSNYKLLGVHYLRYQTSDLFTFTTINATDGFQDTKDFRKTHFRFTSGGRVERTGKSLYLTLSAYYQYGHTPDGLALRAFYFQPEVRYRFPKLLTLRLGAEVFSGDDATTPSEVSHSFDALYGVNHRFLGSMDYFTRFPKDLNNAGLVAPYLFAIWNIHEKWTFRTDQHLFFSENHFLAGGELIDPFLGFEQDILLTYTPNSYTEVQLGYSYMLPTQSMEYIKKGGNSTLWQDWAFLMITFKPELFKWEK
ncbi:MAG: alginate export family protein [Saprospiraceae bacterium]